MDGKATLAQLYAQESAFCSGSNKRASVKPRLADAGLSRRVRRYPATAQCPYCNSRIKLRLIWRFDPAIGHNRYVPFYVRHKLTANRQAVIQMKKKLSI